MKMITERLKFADIFPDKAVKVAQRLHIKKDEIPFVRKYYTAEKDKTEIKKKERAVISYISTGKKDRDGEKLIPEGVLLENYRKNPIVPFGHDYRTVPPAKNMWIKKDEKGLVAKTVFAKNQRAEDIYQAYTEDIGGTGPLLNAWSVGFIPIEWEDTDKKALEKDPNLPKRTYNKWELLEYSAVPIPSCPEALTIAVEKNLIPETLKKDLEIEIVKDKEIKITIEDVEDVEKAHKAHVGTKIANESADKIVEVLVEKDEEESDIERKKEFAKAVGYLGELDNLKYEVVKDEFGKKKEKMSTVGKPGGDRHYSKIEDLGWVRTIKGKELFKDEDIITKPETIGYYKAKEEEIRKELIKQGFYKSEKEMGEIKRLSEHINFNDETVGVQFGERRFLVHSPDGKIEEITKPETTENYHRIPVSEGHDGHRIRTITISASQGIKALYCGTCKVVKTYLFDVNKWTMAEAQAWVREHKRELGECLQKYFTDGEAPEKEEYQEIIKSIIEMVDKELSEEKETIGEVTDKLIEETDKKEDFDLFQKCLDSLHLGYMLSEIDEFEKFGIGMCRLQIEGKNYYFDSDGKLFSEPKFKSNDIKEIIELVTEQYEGRLSDKNEVIADLKEGRVLSRKNRGIVKNAKVALDELLKADAAGTTEDEESETGTVTEREIELEKEGKREFSKEEIAEVVKEVSGKQMGDILKDAFKKALDPEKIKAMVGEGIRLELDKLRGKVT